jgi:hypothetical protein
MTEPAFGLNINLIDTDPLPPTYGDFSVIGLVLPSDDANATTFPLNTPVDINTGDPATLTALGSGPLAQAILRINAQLADLQRSARAVVVRVATGETDDATIANIIGDPTTGTGLYALLKAPQMLGVTPRLIGAPGFTGKTNFAILAPMPISAGGADYTHATVTFNPVGAAGTVQFTGGAVSGIALTNPGNYPEGTVVTAAIAGDGNGATVGTLTLERLANPICAALPAILEALMAHAIVGGPGTTKTDAIGWQGTLNSKRLIPVDNWEIIAAGDDTAYEDGAASALGIGVRVDFQHSGFPFWSFANQPVQGLLGLKRIDSFSLVDGATDAQVLLAAGVGVTVRGDHSDTSLTDSGWQLICYRNASTDAQWNLLNKTRGRDCIHLALLRSIRQRLGVDNVTLHGVQAVLNDMTAIAADLTSKECLIGWSIGFRSADNTIDNLRAGKFTVFFDGEQPAPILEVTIQSGLDENALLSEMIALDTQLTSVGG